MVKDISSVIRDMWLIAGFTKMEFGILQFGQDICERI
mgnify:CR=1 FL=1